ncbi:hypothetical protein BDP55DRAFT_287149 [Colletotrichum godetiae]|uniref:Uncharacterized protein n=1 Tax=Colletotrichum godetiae TaxID=1209918 RepID=A0AAJ0ERW9_9PEZI|nr:uncharacterized protein BDP55DRAFT_287149 [Colletotrichum godetiae]KAK1671753.1 hypothetical protein BDP55DRAFT_287149 [Colletotrichum godetiae]
MSTPIAEPCSVSEEAATAISKYISQLDDNLRRQFENELNRVLKSYQGFRQRCQQNLLSGLPLKHALEDKSGVMAQIRREFPCYITNFTYDNIADISFTAYEYAVVKPEPYTMPIELLTIGLPPPLDPSSEDLLPSLHLNTVRRNGGKANQTMSASTVGKNRPESFVFLYTLDGARSYWILTCPRKDCQNREFSRNPITSGDAKAHFKQCKVPFINEEKIVRKYGTKVIPHRRDSRDMPISRQWIARHNRNIGRGVLCTNQEDKQGGRGASSVTTEDELRESD